MGARGEAPTHPTEIARREGFNEGVDAAQAVISKALQEALRRMGIHDTEPIWKETMSAVDAVPAQE